MSTFEYQIIVVVFYIGKIKTNIQINELPRTLVSYGLWCFNITYWPFLIWQSFKRTGLCSFYKHLLREIKNAFWVERSLRNCKFSLRYKTRTLWYDFFPCKSRIPGSPRKRNGILFWKLFWPTVLKNCSSYWENCFANSRLKVEKCLKSLYSTIYSNSEKSEQFMK